MIMQIMINLPQILIWPIKTIQRVSVPNLKLFGSIKTELQFCEIKHFFKQAKSL